MEFREFGKISRLNREVIVTEKIDGTNAQITIVRDDQSGPYDVLTCGVLKDDAVYYIFAGSRNRYIAPTDDNYGFASWVFDHACELLELGEGSHYGEWWGAGIQRRYGLAEKRFSLFNVSRWEDSRPACCHVVPVLARGIGFDCVNEALERLRREGSVAAPGFMNPEGVVAFHCQSRTSFKVMLERDSEHKMQRAA